MRRVELSDGADLAQWREAARALLADGVPPDQVLWPGGAQDDLLGAGADMFERSVPAQPGVAVARRRVASEPRVPREFLELAGLVLAHADPRRHALLYRLLWRIAHGERALLAMVTDDDVAWARHAAKAVSREKHKMKAFVRFREVADGQGAVYVAWFEPEHDVLPQVAPFFVRRFAGMRWSILTPARSAHWDGATLHLGDGARRGDAPAGDGLEDLWRVYYANIFNPARLKVGAMVKEMPVRYWKNMPEAALIPALVRDAGTRMQAMVDAAPTVPQKIFPAPLETPGTRRADAARLRERGVPAMPGTPREPGGSRPADVAPALPALQAAVSACRACPLWQPATQAVPGEGPADARIMVVGEQPGDREDLVGRPFVGPAGQLLDRALAEAGIARDALYLTNAVKHFKFRPTGKRRLHVRADAAEQTACRPWLEAELAAVRPRMVLCLGATAAQAMLGRGFALLSGRGRWYRLEDGLQVLPTVHPSWLLRLSDAERAAAWPGFIADVRLLQTAATLA
ncbi:UdgX family uracil-DNA binding protein [Luteimonas sp. MC1750]|uniref:UdgX family uracil-DNA binding protein n=1 Tax=Luteimonas sp. MC1750 TaxID=2799326 RepID=UPI0018F0B2EF|nr:UdgX family uracil-DNA binding protein [Luteimonas sp. MC1750]MBJ6983728.1 UdgX family uracil-DNA binding protein [Luteimonas sp. MC1750]QQO06563.1 UdgX family uracil-DNA binding protein [Luteimonas sp. MC1750]